MEDLWEARDLRLADADDRHLPGGKLDRDAQVERHKAAGLPEGQPRQAHGGSDHAVPGLGREEAAQLVDERAGGGRRANGEQRVAGLAGAHGGGERVGVDRPVDADDAAHPIKREAERELDRGSEAHPHDGGEGGSPAGVPLEHRRGVHLHRAERKLQGSSEACAAVAR